MIETEATPATRPNYWGWVDRGPGGGTELLNGRIVELAEDDARMQFGDPHVGIVDYVPTSSVARGDTLARTGGKSGLPCTGCHGTDLRGQGSVPPLAGRAATYTARMLWDIETGARGGAAVTPMKFAVAGLTEADITNFAAYLACLAP